MEYARRIVRSKRKTVTLEIKEENVLLVRAPLKMSEKEIMEVISRHEKWIETHMKKVIQRNTFAQSGRAYTVDELKELAQKALTIIPPKVEEYAKVLGVTYGRITIRNQKTKWGSCSAKGNLNFNCYLVNAPEEVLDYVIVHELCHRLEMNHSREFWELVERVMPNYKEQRNWLKEQGSSLMIQNLDKEKK